MFRTLGKVYPSASNTRKNVAVLLSSPWGGAGCVKGRLTLVGLCGERHEQELLYTALQKERGQKLLNKQNNS